MPRDHQPCPTCGHLTTPITDPQYEQIDVQQRSDHHKVLRQFSLRKTPRTADSVAASLNMSPNEVASRLLELRRGGLVQYVIDARTGTLLLRKTRRGALARLQRLTPAGRAVLARLPW